MWRDGEPDELRRSGLLSRSHGIDVSPGIDYYTLAFKVHTFFSQVKKP